MDRTATARQLGHVISEWLLDSPIRLKEGRNKGAILSWLSAARDQHHIYPEALGYYLTTMRFMMLACPIKAWRAGENLIAAFDWLELHVARSGIPLTRIYLNGDPNDWRNAAVFSFDCATILRGLVAAADVVGYERVSPVARPFLSALPGHVLGWDSFAICVAE